MSTIRATKTTKAETEGKKLSRAERAKLHSSTSSTSSIGSVSSTNKSSVPKTFITKFKKLTGLIINPIETYENYTTHKSLFDIKPDIHINAYVKDLNNLLLVVYVNRGNLRDGHMSYERDLTDSELFSNEEVINTDDIHDLYIIIFRNETNYKVFHYDYVANNQDVVEYQPNYQLSKLAEVFHVSSISNSEAQNEFKKIVDTIWSGTGFGSDQRIAFNVITWILLSHDEIAFKTTSEGKKLSLKQCIELNKIHCEQIGTSEANTEQFKSDDKLLKSIKPIEIIEAFERVITWKMSTHEVSQSAAQLKIINKQTAQLRKTIEGLYTKKSERNALMIATSIYDRLYVKNPNLDINKLAFEYENNWNNRTAQTVVAKKGQIYTHHMMKDLIIKILSQNITDGAVCYDPTCGTGGFTEHFYKYCSTHEPVINNILAYGNEIDEDCSNMAWISGLCSNQDVRVFNLNCFDPEIKTELIPKNSVDFLLMNPPYGMNKAGSKIEMPEGFDWSEDPLFGRKKPTLSEWTFCRYNMDSFLKVGGWFAYVIPVSTVSENPQNEYDKQQMIDNCEIWFVIKIREDIFTPQAGKACCLVIGRFLKGLRTLEEKRTWKTKLIDFTDDGGEIKAKKGAVEYNIKELERLWNERILDNKCLDGIHIINNENDKLNSIKYETNNEGQQWYIEQVLTPDMNWIYTKRDDINFSQQRKDFANFISQRCYALITSNIEKTNWKALEVDENEDCEWKEFNINKLFNLVGRGKKNAKGNPSGPYPLIGASAKNNGIVDYIDSFEFGNNENDLHITVAADGNGAGSSFVQKGYFNAVADVVILRLQPEFEYLNDSLVMLSYIMTEQFTKTYNWSHKLNTQRLMNETISLPFNIKTGKIDLSITNRFKLNVEYEAETLPNNKINTVQMFILPELVKHVDENRIAFTFNPSLIDNECLTATLNLKHNKNIEHDFNENIKVWKNSSLSNVSIEEVEHKGIYVITGFLKGDNKLTFETLCENIINEEDGEYYNCSYPSFVLNTLL